MDNETLKNLRERRSIRRYKKEQITEEQLNALLEAGTYAAHRNGRPVAVDSGDSGCRGDCEAVRA